MVLTISNSALVLKWQSGKEESKGLSNVACKCSLVNLKGMLELAPMFVAAWPVADDAVCDWLAANISIGVFCAKEREETIREFRELAIENRNEPSLALKSRCTSVKMLPVITRFFDGMEPTVKVLKAIGFCCQRTKSPIESCKFIVDTVWNMNLHTPLKHSAENV